MCESAGVNVCCATAIVPERRNACVLCSGDCKCAGMHVCYVWMIANVQACVCVMLERLCKRAKPQRACNTVILMCEM